VSVIREEGKPMIVESVSSSRSSSLLILLMKEKELSSEMGNKERRMCNWKRERRERMGCLCERENVQRE
jgi:hypothetical protein